MSPMKEGLVDTAMVDVFALTVAPDVVFTAEAETIVRAVFGVGLTSLLSGFTVTDAPRST